MVKYITLGYILALLTFVACGASYKYYGLEMPTTCYDHGKLLGPKPEDDIPLTLCKPEARRKGKCVVMESSEFFAAKTEIETLRAALKACERGRPPG